MDPKTYQQLIIVVAAMLPGFVFQVVLGWLRGATESDKSAASRVFAFAALTIIFDAAYVWIFGAWMRNTTTSRADILQFARSLSFVLIVLVLVIPSLAAFAWHYFSVVRRNKTFKPSFRALFRGVPVPTSWDYAADRAFGTEAYIRIQFKDGRYLGGYIGNQNHISLSPWRHDLFIANLRQLDEDGYFAEDEVSNKKYPYSGHGVWINCEDALSVEFLSRQITQPVDDKKLTKQKWRVFKWFTRMMNITGWFKTDLVGRGD